MNVNLLRKKKIKTYCFKRGFQYRWTRKKGYRTILGFKINKEPSDIFNLDFDKIKN